MTHKQKIVALCTISDSQYVLAVYTLIASLRQNNVDDPICVLGVSLNTVEIELLTQFPQVTVIKADPSNTRNPASRKGEAILATAELYQNAEFITLLDGDCIATGNLHSAFIPERSGLSVRIKSDEEDGSVFIDRYDQHEPQGKIPLKILEVWKKDVGERSEPRMLNTVTGGNLTISRDSLYFIKKWHDQIMKVLPQDNFGSHNHKSFAYSQVDESVLNSLVCFAHKTPEINRYLLDIDKEAYLGHLGACKFRPWVIWQWDRVQYYPMVLKTLKWTRDHGYKLPPLPWSYRTSSMPLVYSIAILEGTTKYVWRNLKKYKKYLWGVDSSLWS